MIARRNYMIVAVLFTTYLLCYLDRMVMASAIPFIAKEFHLSSVGMGEILGAFFLGYSVMQFPGGILADHFGGRRVMTAAIVGWSLFTALTGAAVSLINLLIVRVLFGLSEGPFPSAASRTVALAFPTSEVGKVNGLQLASIQLGAAFAPAMVASLVVHWGWRWVFYILLVPGAMMALLVWLYIDEVGMRAHGAPTHEASIRSCDDECHPPRSIAAVLRTRPVWWCSLALFCANVAAWGLMNWLPTYLLQARGLSIAQMGALAPLPFVAGAVGYAVGGRLSDKYFREQRYKPVAVGFILSGAATYLAAIASTAERAIGCLTLAFLFLCIASAGLFTLPMVLVSKDAIGAAFGLVNTAGQIAAVISPLLVGYALAWSHGEFAVIFYGFAGLFIAAACASTQIRQTVGVQLAEAR